MLILGIETSCDETAAAVVRCNPDSTPRACRVLSNVVASQHELHAEYAGVVPEIASRAHVEAILPVVRSAMRDAGVRLDQLDAIAVGHRPGLVGSLLVGVSAIEGQMSIREGDTVDFEHDIRAIELSVVDTTMTVRKTTARKKAQLPPHAQPIRTTCSPPSGSPSRAGTPRCM